MSPERLRDATFQRLSDWSDARFGIGCFGIARRLLVLTAACTVAVALVMRGDGHTSSLTVYEWVTASLAQLIAVGYLATVEGRSATDDGPVVIPPMRHWTVPAFAFLWGAVPAAIGTIMAALGAGMLATLGSTPTVVGLLVYGAASVFALVGTAAAMLFASCQWNRRPRTRSRCRRVATPA